MAEATSASSNLKCFNQFMAFQMLSWKQYEQENTRLLRKSKTLSKRLQQRNAKIVASVIKKLQGSGNTIGFIENGRVTLTEKKIRHIVETYGFTMELFHQLLKQPLLRHETVEQGQEILAKLDENKLRVIFPMLQSMASN